MVLRVTMPFYHFRNFDDLSRSIRLSEALAKADFDIVVGIPRSGMVVATQIALFRNLPMTDIDSFVEGRVLPHGSTREARGYKEGGGYRRPLVVDDSVNRGTSMDEAREKLKAVDCDPLYFAAYVHDESREKVDIFLENLPLPRVFTWNVMHHSIFLYHSCFDLDGVLCPDPTDEENDDGENYLQFLANTPPLVKPTGTLGHIVTSRLERYRAETEAWLENAGISFNQLHMIDLPSAEERRRQGAHAPFKAKVFKQTGASTFVESDAWQAQQIFQLSGRPVLDYTNMVFHEPGRRARAVHQSRHRLYEGLRTLKRAILRR